MNVIFSFNKTGFELDRWTTELQAASTSEFRIIPFNHGRYLNPNIYLDAWSLDRLYQSKNAALMQMYADLELLATKERADVLFVTNCPPYHPDFLKSVDRYKVLYSTDDPDSTYKRNIPYLHAYNHVMFCDPDYSQDMGMSEKMRFCGMANADWLPIGVFDFEYDTTQNDGAAGQRDIDIIYIGGFWRQKMPILARVRKSFGPRFRMFGFYRFKANLYINARFGYGQWIRPASYVERVRLYRRAKIGFNVHWNEYGLGNQRLYHLPANGVMQISDSPRYLDTIYKVGQEIDLYYNVDELIEKLHYYLAHDDERLTIAEAGYQRTMKDYRLQTVLRRSVDLIDAGMKRIDWGTRR